MNTVRLTALLTAMLLTIGLAPHGVQAISVVIEISQTDAVKRAFDYTGLGVQPDVTVSAEATTVPADDDVPFLRLAGKPAWRVTLDNVRIITRGPDGKAYENPNIHRLDVWLDRADGRLLKIISPLPADIGPSAQPTLAEREDWMERGPERYEGLPPEMPRIDFMRALQSAADAGGRTTAAKQIEALYVLVRHAVKQDTPYLPCRNTPCPRWMITCRYVPPGGPHRGHVGFDHDLVRIDANTGKWFSVGNTL